MPAANAGVNDHEAASEPPDGKVSFGDPLYTFAGDTVPPGRSPCRARAAEAVSEWCGRLIHTMPLASAGAGRRAHPGGPPSAVAGLVSTTVGRSAVAAKARVTRSGQRSGGSVNSNCGSTVCITVVHAS